MVSTQLLLSVQTHNVPMKVVNFVNDTVPPPCHAVQSTSMVIAEYQSLCFLALCGCTLEHFMERM